MGKSPLAGQIFRCPDQAATLAAIAESHGESFYRGAFADKIVQCAESNGGAIKREDLENHVSEWVEPISIDYHETCLHEIPPNGQGLAALIALGIPGTGISMQNRGCGFVIEKGHPNCVDGGKRPYHTIIPGFVTQNDQPLMSFGVMGGHMQPQGHVQMMVRIFDYGQNPQTACDAPRWMLNQDSSVSLEYGISSHVIEDLRKRGHKITPTPHHTLHGDFGGGQLIYRLEDGYCAASDPRKDGQALGF